MAEEQIVQTVKPTGGNLISILDKLSLTIWIALLWILNILKLKGHLWFSSKDCLLRYLIFYVFVWESKSETDSHLLFNQKATIHYTIFVVQFLTFQHRMKKYHIMLSCLNHALKGHTTITRVFGPASCTFADLSSLLPMWLLYLSPISCHAHLSLVIPHSHLCINLSRMILTPANSFFTSINVGTMFSILYSLQTQHFF